MAGRRVVGAVMMVVGILLAGACVSVVGDELGSHTWPMVAISVAIICTGHVAWVRDDAQRRVGLLFDFENWLGTKPFDREHHR